VFYYNDDNKILDILFDGEDTIETDDDFDYDYDEMVKIANAFYYSQRGV